MRLVYLGTPLFAVPPLEALAAAGHDIVAVFTQPDRPKGRGQQLEKPPVKQAAERLGLPVFQPERIRLPEPMARLKELQVPAMVVVGYGQILPQALIDLAPLGIVNIHASLLPKYRGAAPIQWAVAEGETRTGVTAMRIDAGLDTGDILKMRPTPIGPEETAEELSARLAAMGAELIVETMADLEAGRIQPEPQDHRQATLARILTKEDGRIDWNSEARQIHNRVRGFQPWPGAFTAFRGKQLRVQRTRPAEETSAALPGTVTLDKRRLLVTCGSGSALELLEVQMEGRGRVSGEAFGNGQRPEPLERLGDS
jgi:methionyl-tRNA formyltransferase